ncbi:MAG: hypothetical protein ACE5FO_09765 [Parvularculaceae bacterium]
MKLHDFVEKTLLEITCGVIAAQKKSSIWIAPGRVEGEVEKSPSLVNFEVVVTTSAEGSGQINILSLADAGAKSSTQHMNKISFSVPVYFQAPKENELSGS